jgi:hypothetical protein
MQKELEKLTATALRRLLIDEIKYFIVSLDHGSTEELYEIKSHSKYILDLLTEKEMKEMGPIIWGKNSTKIEKDDPMPNSIIREN